MRRLCTLMARPRAPLAVALVGMALVLPATGAGLLGDDYIHRSVLLGAGEVGAEARPVVDLFAFVPEGPRRAATLSLGTLTWWAHPEIRVALFRPLAAITHMLDYRLWPDAIPVQHLHSILWYGLAVLAVASFYRRVHGPTPVAALAAVCFAVEDAHAMPAGWLANRHSLMALAVGVGVLHAHRRWRLGGGLPWAAGAVAAFGLALSCGEAALGAAAYVLAWQVTMDAAPWRRRAAALVPYGVLVVAWRIAYEHLGFGTHGSGLYIDPGRHPVDFLVALVERWPILQVAQWFQVPVDAFIVLPRAGQIGLAVVSAALCLALVRAFAPLLVERREARFWATGMSLSLIPLCAAFPMARLLLFSGVGAFALLALLVERAGLLPGGARGDRPRHRALAGALVILHGPLAAVLLLASAAGLSQFGAVFDAGARTVPADANAPEQTFVFVTGQEVPVVYVAIIGQLEHPATAPRRVALLGSMFRPNSVYRGDSHTLVLTAAGGFLHEDADRLMRSLDVPFRVGERIERADFTAEVRAVTPDGRPSQVAFRFREPLESPSLRWFAWVASGAVEFPLPQVGARVELPPVGILSALGLH